MGMTDNQFASYRRAQLEEFEELLENAIATKADKIIITKLEKLIERAKKDIEK